MPHPLKELSKNKSLFNSLALEYGTPLYVYDKIQLIKNINKIYSALASNFEDFQKIHYFSIFYNSFFLAINF